MKTVAVVGSTGAVGLEMLSILEERNFPIKDLKLLASKNSAGKTQSFAGKDYTVEELTADSFAGVDIALFSAGGSRSKEFAPAAVKAGALVIDNSSAYRMDPNVPLVVPEINPEVAKDHQGIIANPNCTTIIMGVALFPIHKKWGIKRIVVSTYQAVSGAGAKAVEEWKTQQQQIFAGGTPKAEIFSHVIANNIFSHDSAMQANGFNEEEMKMVNETRKIFGDESIQVAPTCIRVPIERAHSESITLELNKPASLDEIRQEIGNSNGVQILDESATQTYPMPSLVSGKNDVLVGRIRSDLFEANTVHMFVCGDQLRKGAALNAVQIAELFL